MLHDKPFSDGSQQHTSFKDLAHKFSRSKIYITILVKKNIVQLMAPKINLDCDLNVLLKGFYSWTFSVVSYIHMNYRLCYDFEQEISLNEKL